MKRSLWRLLTVASLGVVVLLSPDVAAAHPLGNFTVNTYSGIQVTPGEVRVEYVVDMAEIPTFQEMSRIDADGDGRASDAERRAWAEHEAPVLAGGLSLEVDGEPVVLRVLSSSMRFSPGQGGLPILRLEATFAGEVPASGRIRFRDGNYPGRVGWREITAVGEGGAAVRDPSVPARSISDALLSYPQDLLSSPLRVTEATFAFAPGPSRLPPASPGSAVRSEARPGVVGGAFADLVARAGPAAPVAALAILSAMAFGALHAIGPGHGKTLIAAYLVGAGGRTRQAVAVGGAVSVMHTASVLALGLLVLSVEGLFPPERVYPWLGLMSGLVALGLGAVLLVVRLGAWEGARRRHGHEGDGAGHRHGRDRGHGHAHAVPEGPVLSRRGLVALAAAGGILPSPTALVVLLASVALHRVVFGLALIGAFSVGLAAALILVGILALRARELVARRMSSRWGRLLPVLSASVIVVVGMVLTARGIAQVWSV